MTEESFSDFRAELPKAFRDDSAPSDEWMESYGAIVLPKLFIDLVGFLAATPMPSGFVMNRLLESKMAEIKEGRFCLIKES